MATSNSDKQHQQQVSSGSGSSGRVLVIPVSENVDEATQVIEWYAANLRSPGDRLVLVRLLIPDCPSDEAAAAAAAMKAAHLLAPHGVVAPRGRGGSAGSSAASSSSSEESSASASASESLRRHSAASSGGVVENQMERQLEASVAQEARLVRRLRRRGLRSFRFIHAFAREFTGCLLTIAADQGACAVLAPLSAFAADHDLARTYHLYKMARIGVIHVPEFY